MPPNLQPHLKGELVELRPLCADDFDALYAVAADPLIWEQHPANDRYQKKVFEVFFQEAMESGGALLVIDRISGNVIGSSRYHGYDQEQSEIEIGWTFLARSHWGGTYNRELKHLMLEHAFGFVDNVILIVGIHNYRSQRALEKIGGLRRGTHLEDTGIENYVYGIEASTYSLAATRQGSV
ncbi:MAG: GNAT family N-acetyltransferase [Planctomycetes bacterium]|nr:GNAT family N-acetyltransferase [Planctomycetota bacterium]